jgi:hypothetical protein
MEHGCIAHQLDAVFVLEEQQSYGTCQCLRIKMWVPVQSASTFTHSVRQCVKIHVCVHVQEAKESRAKGTIRRGGGERGVRETWGSLGATTS